MSVDPCTGQCWFVRGVSGVCYKVIVSRGLGVACFLVILGLIDGVTQYEIDTMSLSNQIERTTLISPV